MELRWSCEYYRFLSLSYSQLDDYKKKRKTKEEATFKWAW